MRWVEALAEQAGSAGQKKEDEMVIVTGDREKSLRCNHSSDGSEEWVEPVRCASCGLTGLRFYRFSAAEISAAEYPWDATHTTSVEWYD